MSESSLDDFLLEIGIRRTGISAEHLVVSWAQDREQLDEIMKRLSDGTVPYMIISRAALERIEP
jgi:hypothetical protein